MLSEEVIASHLSPGDDSAADYEDANLPTADADERGESTTSSDHKSISTVPLDNTSESVLGDVDVENVTQRARDDVGRPPCRTRLAAEEGSGKTTGKEDFDAELTVSTEEQCVDATVFGTRHCVTASHVNEEAPKFWQLQSGQIDVELTQLCAARYRKSLVSQNITFAGRHHAQLFCFDEYLVYVRKRSTSMTLCVFRVSPADQHVSVLSHLHLPDSYFLLFLPESCGQFSLLVVREGALERRAADMTLLRAIDVRKLTEDVPNMSSSSGKKRLLSYAVAVTEDRRYFVVVCPTAGGKCGRYMDVVDLVENLYV